MGKRDGKTPNTPMWRRGPYQRPEDTVKERPRPPRNRPSHTPYTTPEEDDGDQEQAEPEVLAPTAEPRPPKVSSPSKGLGPALSETLALERAQQLASQSVDLCVSELQKMIVAWNGDIALTGPSVKAINYLLELATGATKAQAKKTGKESKKGNAKDLKDFLTAASKANPPPESDE